MTAPFVVFAMPRSRSFWLSRFLSAGGWHCGHDELRHMRSLDDVRSWLAQPITGTVETAAGPFWRLLTEHAPDARVVVLRRPVAEVVDSLVWLGFDPAVMRPAMQRQDAKLCQIAARWPGALTVGFSDLDDEAVCARVFEHCTGLPHSSEWWRTIAPLNLQTDMAATVRYARAYAPQIERLRSIAAHKSLALLRRETARDIDGVEIGQEGFDGYFTDGEAMRGEQYAAVGEAPEYRHQVNYAQLRRLAEAGALMTTIARHCGRVVGWLLTIISPSLDDARVTSAYHTSFFASPSFPGLGIRLAIAANEAATARGCGEIIGRAGTRGDGPKLGLLWRLLGFAPCGSLYMLKTGI